MLLPPANNELLDKLRLEPGGLRTKFSNTLRIDVLKRRCAFPTRVDDSGDDVDPPEVDEEEAADARGPLTGGWSASPASDWVVSWERAEGNPSPPVEGAAAEAMDEEKAAPFAVSPADETVAGPAARGLFAVSK